VRAIVVPNSLDENAIRPATASVEPVVGFIGTYSYTPNLQAALFLGEQVFPVVLKQFPQAVLRLAGAHMPNEAAARLRAVRNVEALGQVPDSGQFMDECAVLALPVFIRGGVPLKVIEAMARGKAIVASPELVDGLTVVDEKDLLIRNSPETFAAAIVSLLASVKLREQLGSAARTTFLRDFSLSGAEAVLRRDSVLMRRSASSVSNSVSIAK
jgi:glycosyltransferase involved in cell wall biosynthesis